MIYAGILAGGIGSRMGVTSVPKQFLLIGGKPVIIHTVEKFLRCGRIDRIYVAVVKEYVSYMQELLRENIEECGRITVIEGGADRNGSIVNVIRDIRKNDASADSILVTHDAVRPFVTPEIIERNIDAALEFGATDTVVPATDTIIRSEDGKNISSIPLRSELFNGQTPQAFRISMFEEDFSALSDEEKVTLTDACGIFYRAGHCVRMVKGDPHNMKISTPFDLLLAEAIIAKERGQN